MGDSFRHDDDRAHHDRVLHLIAGEHGPAGAPGKETLTEHLGEGTGLPYKQKSLFEASLGKDLSHVRLYTGEPAVKLAQKHRARAFALGTQIIFNKGEYRPNTPEGDLLLAHEVAHVVQQHGATVPTSFETTTAGDSAESEADHVARAMVKGQPAKVTSKPMAIARKGVHDPADREDPPHGPAGHNDANTPPPPAPGTNPADPAAPTTPPAGEAGDCAVAFVGQEDLAGTYPVGPRHDVDGAASTFKSMHLPAAKADEGGGDGAGGGDHTHPPPGGHSPAPPSTPAPGSDTPLPPELAAEIDRLKADVADTGAAADADAAAFKADLSAKRDEYDAQQDALILEQLRQMSPEEQRATLVDFGYDEGDAARMSDQEVKDTIQGIFATEARKARILGMTPEELAALTPDRKIQFLIDLGIDAHDLHVIGQDKACRAFDDVLAVAHIPGQHKVTIKISNNFFNKKSWEVNVKVDDGGNPEITVKKKKGFFSKLWQWVKALIPIILTVLAPVTAGISLIVLAVYEAYVAIKTGDWLGAVIAIAGAFVGVGMLPAIQAATSGMLLTVQKIATVAKNVAKLCEAARAAMIAMQAQNAGSILAAIALGAGAFAGFFGGAATKFGTMMDTWAKRLEKWSAILNGAQHLVDGIQNHDPLAAVMGALEAASASVNTQSRTGQNLARAEAIVKFIAQGRAALAKDPPDYGALAEAALGIAAQLKQSKRLEDAKRIVGAANKVIHAWGHRSQNPAELIAAVIELAQAIEHARYDQGEGSDQQEDPVQAAIARYSRIISIVKNFTAVVAAVNARPHPDYMGALDAAMQLVADLTDSGFIDQASVIVSRLNAWTAAVRSKDDNAILAAAEALGAALNGMISLIQTERAAARAAAQHAAPPNQLPTDDAGPLPGEPAPPANGNGNGNPTHDPNNPNPNPNDPNGPKPDPHSDTPNANYTVKAKDTLSKLSKHFKVSVEDLHKVNPQIVGDDIYAGQHLYIPGADHPTNDSGLDPRSDTPNWNYIVQGGDMLWIISYRFNDKLDYLRTLNPQLVNDIIYPGQKLYVPGADHAQDDPRPPAPTPPTPTDDTRTQNMRTDCRKELADERAAVADYRSHHGLGAFFYAKVDELDRDLRSFEGTVNNMQATYDDLKAGRDHCRNLYNSVNAVYDLYGRGQEVLLNVGLFVATFVREGAGVLISALDRTRIISAVYSTAITAIEDRQAGKSPAYSTFHAFVAGMLETIPDEHLGHGISDWFADMLKDTVEKLNDFFFELYDERDQINLKTLRRKQAELLASIGVRLAGGPVFERLKLFDRLDLVPALEDKGKGLCYETFKYVSDKVLEKLGDNDN